MVFDLVVNFILLWISARCENELNFLLDIYRVHTEPSSLENRPFLQKVRENQE